MPPRRAFLFATLLLLVACADKKGKEVGGYFGTLSPKHDPNTLFFSNGAEPQSIDPGIVWDSPGNLITRELFEGLTRYHPETLEPIPGMAEKWERSEDGLTWTFHLREASWTDGTPVTARQFVDAWTRVLDPVTGAQYANMLWVLKNGEAFNNGKLKDPAQVGVRAVDDKTLEVQLEYPAPYFLHLTPYSPFFPIRRDVIAKHGDAWTRPGNLVSNGAFTLKSWRLRYEIVLEKSATYWDAGNVALQRAVAMAIEDQHTMLTLYQSGTLDWTGTSGRIPPETLPFLRHHQDFGEHPILGVYYLWLQTEKPPLDDPRVRRALDQAIDKEKITRFVLKGGQLPTDHLVPDKLFVKVSGYESPKGNPFDVAAARKLLAEAGFPDGKGFPKITYSYNTDESHRQVGEAIQAMWKENLGVEVELQNLEYKVHLSNQTRGDFQIARSGWWADYPEASTFLEQARPGSAQNHSRWINPEYSRLLDLALRAPTDQKRNELYAKAEQLVIDDTPLIPLYVYTYNQFVKPYVKGIHPNMQHIHPLRAVRLELPR